uniref:Chromo domain-containing protein n=1 Tax=Peronospora matthiolae TaxID=2874970 RepID=A0AAV1U519_9STRA
MGNAYTIELPRKVRTDPTFYVGRLRPYYPYEPVSRCEEHLRGREPRPPSSGPVSTSQSGRLAERPIHAAQRRLDELQPARHEENESNVRSQVARLQTRQDLLNVCALRNCNIYLQGHAAQITESVYKPCRRVTDRSHGSDPEHRAYPTLELDQVFPSLTNSLEDSGGGQRFLAERILNHSDVKGVRKSYLVRWRGYPPAWDSWDPRA